jgi:hypothetical protein
MNIRSLTKLAVFCALWPALASAESADGILPQSLILSLQVEELFEYRCPSNTQCQLRCGTDEQTIEYQNRATGFMPEPTSCILDDLEFVAQIPVIDGSLNRAPDDVIFDLQPSN